MLPAGPRRAVNTQVWLFTTFLVPHHVGLQMGDRHSHSAAIVGVIRSSLARPWAMSLGPFIVVSFWQAAFKTMIGVQVHRIVKVIRTCFWLVTWICEIYRHLPCHAFLKCNVGHFSLLFWLRCFWLLNTIGHCPHEWKSTLKRFANILLFILRFCAVILIDFQPFIAKDSWSFKRDCNLNWVQY